MLQRFQSLFKSMRLRTIIVDDEPVARKVLREELELLDDVEIVSEADNGATALEEIALRQPDLVFLAFRCRPWAGSMLYAGLKMNRAFR
jgi:DNA-binding NarL/FixJ family response regulator